MDERIYKYKRALAVDFYVLAPENQSIAGPIIRREEADFHGQCDYERTEFAKGKPTHSD